MEHEEMNLQPTEASEEVETVTPETGEIAECAEAVVEEKKNFFQKIWYYVHDVFFINFLCNKLKFEKWKGWVYLLPCLVLLLIFTVWPIINTVRMAFLDGFTAQNEFNGVKMHFGIENFQKVFDDDINGYTFLDCIKNTVLLCVITVPLSTLLALLIAVCLNSIKPLQRFFQTIFFLPYVTNSIAIGMVFAAMFQVGLDYRGEITELIGIMNTIIGWFGVEPINWIGMNSSYFNNMTIMVIYIVWNALPFKILILLGGLQSVNKQYYEAARIDSTPRWRVFTKITVPMLSPMLAYVIITGFIGGFKEYSSIVGVFGEFMGPSLSEYSLITMVGYIYPYLGAGGPYAKAGEYGIASAAAIILFLIIFAVTMVNLYVSKKKTHY